ncbi:hypothetical protein NYQ35_16020 [Curtobacterium flaccumfaciens pv. flaccumfaciens]|uniref:hypothetical protein n=1 Tax=Curtobacterium flaccumfaciens TaxID=2035 RepID=UPI00217DA232|nr:hypothetical protein [Curtobacterium flaccumfaciens]MCS6570313.1 hypothetical protein [Curtobacterium flaccumfaciens pv. flaccumfaciens]MCS6585169.1 hypothetical protein [Curtobacterium flaccumfaciens pv. flaccumfaciens]
MTDPVDTDRLRELADDDEALGYPEAAAVERAAADEVDRLRTLIATQQHDDLCAVWTLNGGTSDDGCTCWKADAL